MIITITKVEELKTKSGEKDYLKVTGIDGKTQKETTKIVFDNLSEKWYLIQAGSTLEFKMNQVYKDGKANWNVIDINPIADKLPPPREPEILPEHEKEIERAKASVTSKTLPAPQELGMWWKELGNRIGDGSLDRDFPHSAVTIKGQYYKKLSEITGVMFKS